MVKLTDIQKKQIEEDLAAYTNEYTGKSREEKKQRASSLKLFKTFWNFLH